MPRPRAKRLSVRGGVAPGAICPHDAEAAPEQLPPEQAPSADTFTLRRLESWASQACRLTPLRSTYCPLQNSAPVGWEHCEVQPPCTFELHVAE